MQHSPASRIRRALLVWQSAAVVVLPVWLLVGWAASGSGSWEILLVIVAAGALAFALLVILALLFARRSVRTTREMPWSDAAAAGALSLAVIGVGTFSPISTWCAVIAVLAAVGAVVLSVRALLLETRDRMQAVLTAIERDARPWPSSPGQPPQPSPTRGHESWAPAEGPDAGRTIRLD